METTNETEKFSITIKGAGTKKEILQGIRSIISAINNSSVYNLQDGIMDEGEALIFESGTYEEYAG